MSKHQRGAVCWPAVLAVTVVSLAGCGLRVPHSEVVAQEQRLRTLTVGPSALGGVGQPGGQLGSTTGTLTPSTTGGSVPGSTTGGAVGTTGGATSGSASGTSTTGTSGSPVHEGGPPIIIGTTGSYSGVSNIGTVARDTLLVWARSVNQQGGINGRQVQVVAVDNASDDNRTLAAVKDLVENKKAIAIVGLGPGGDIAPFMPYLQSKQVPLVGGFATTDNWWKHTMAFPQGTYGPVIIKGYDAAVARVAKKKNIAILYCAEAAACKGSADMTAAYAPQEGLTVKLQQSVSIAQPDFTSSCLQARGNGVEAMVLFVDGATIKRIAADCASQGFRPVFAGLGDDSHAGIANLQGMLNPSDTFSWEDSSTPATAAYQRAMKTYGPRVPRSIVGAGTWAAGEQFRKALEGATGTITSATVLQGLWKMKNETLGGLVPGMTFAKGKTANKNPCFLPLQVADKKWRMAGARICLTA